MEKTDDQEIKKDLPKLSANRRYKNSLLLNMPKSLIILEPSKRSIEKNGIIRAYSANTH